MIEVIVVGEGPTEEVFVRDVLGPPLAHRDIFLHPWLIPTSPGVRGGALSRQRVLRYLRNTLRERRDVYVTTFFDLSGLKPDFPGQAEATGLADPLARADAIEARLGEAVVQEAECRPERFLPHVQPHEFEALLFTDVHRFPHVEPEWKTYLEEPQAARSGGPTPEHINDGQDTHLSARLKKLLRPRYEKVLHGSAMTARIGLERIRAECGHFGQWLTRIEALPPLGPVA